MLGRAQEPAWWRYLSEPAGLLEEQQTPPHRQLAPPHPDRARSRDRQGSVRLLWENLLSRSCWPLEGSGPDLHHGVLFILRKKSGATLTRIGIRPVVASAGVGPGKILRP